MECVPLTMVDNQNNLASNSGIAFKEVGFSLLSPLLLEFNFLGSISLPHSPVLHFLFPPALPLPICVSAALSPYP